MCLPNILFFVVSVLVTLVSPERHINHLTTKRESKSVTVGQVCLAKYKVSRYPAVS